MLTHSKAVDTKPYIKHGSMAAAELPCRGIPSYLVLVRYLFHGRRAIARNAGKEKKKSSDLQFLELLLCHILLMMPLGGCRNFSL